MEANGSVNSSDGIEDDTSTRPDSSRLSLGSSPSELSEEEDDTNPVGNPDDDFPLDDGDGSLTPTDKIIMEDDDDEQNGQVEFDDDDGLFEDSSDTLSNAPMDIDEREEDDGGDGDDDDDEEPFSSLSSVPVPLSPEPHGDNLRQRLYDDDDDDDEEQQVEEEEEEEEEEQRREIKKEKESSSSLSPQQRRRRKQLEKEVHESEKQEETPLSPPPTINEKEEGVDDDDEERVKEENNQVTKPISAAPPTTAPTPLFTRREKRNKKKEKKNYGSSGGFGGEENSSPSSSSSSSSLSNNETHSTTAKENEKPPVNSGKKRRGSVALEQEEWQQRRTSKLLENKEAMAGLANVHENADQQQQSPSSLESPTTRSAGTAGANDEKNHGETEVAEAVVAAVTTTTPTSSGEEREEETSSMIAQVSINGQKEDDEDRDSKRQEQGRLEDGQRQQTPQPEEDERLANRNEGGDDVVYQERHKEALDALTHIEVQFAKLRDKMYKEKMTELNEEALMIARGTHPELVTMMETIEKKKNKRIQTAEAWRKHKRISYQQQFEGLEYQANIDYVSGKNALRRDILGSLNRKRWDLDNERDKLNEPLTDADRVPDPNTLFKRKRMQSEESRDLQRITQSVGFPVAPRTTGIAPNSIEEDLVALGIVEARSSSGQDKSNSSSSSNSNVGSSATMTTTPAVPLTSASMQQPQSQQAAGRLPSSNKKVLDTSLSTNNAYPSAHIYTFQGQLHYHGRIYRKGDQFTVVDANTGRYNAKLLTATENEVHIQRTDGSKTKLPFAQMSRGKFQIYAKHS